MADEFGHVKKDAITGSKEILRGQDRLRTHCAAAFLTPQGLNPEEEAPDDKRNFFVESLPAPRSAFEMIQKQEKEWEHKACWFREERKEEEENGSSIKKF